MADQDLDDILDDGTGTEDDGKTKVEEPASKRIQRLIGQKEQIKTEAEAQVAEEREKRQAAEFRADFADIRTTYPQAEKHKDEIAERVKKGYSVKAATLEVLDEKGELNTNSQTQTRRVDPTAGAGGSVETAPSLKSGERKDPKEMTQAERIEALKGLEREGKLRVTPRGGLQILE